MGIRRQTCVLVVLDAVLLATAYISAFYLRLGWQETTAHLAVVGTTLPIVLAISLYVHLRHGLFNAILRYASLDTAFAVFRSVVLSVLLSCLALFLVVRLDGIPRTVFVIYGMTALLLVGAARIAVRARPSAWRHRGRDVRVLLYGAGDTAELVLRGLKSSNELEYRAVGILDDDPKNAGKQMHGVKVFGGVSRFEPLVEQHGVEELWVCLQDLPGEKLRELYEAASAHSVRVKMLPKLGKALLGEDLGRFQEPNIADLLRRPPRSLDRDRMRQWIAGRRVLITGAGGSIGSELARQVAGLGPSALALCDACEAKLFDVHGELRGTHASLVDTPYLVDVRDAAGVSRMFSEARPDIIFHAAAYKHVPLVELNPCEGVLTNVQGLANVALAAAESGVKEFVFISTDKAVRPVSVMGATKRLGERIIQVLNRRESTRYCAVRFGNVLGSSGSVVPIFQEQIRKGGPVTVTHPEMTRYFMLVSEAVELVIQAGSIGKGGEIFILDMGEPVRIADMARDLIRLMAREPGSDIEIQYVGPRPGEKIHEELLISTEDSRTSFEDIWIDGEPEPKLEWEEMARGLKRLSETAKGGDRAKVLLFLQQLAVDFAPAFPETRAKLEECRREHADERLSPARVARQRPFTLAPELTVAAERIVKSALA